MRVFGIGRLTKDIELKSSQSGTSYLSNSIACDRKYGEKKTDFFNIKAFGKTAEAMDKFLHKGSKIFIEGDIQVDEYTDKTGVKKSSVSIVISSWEFAEGKGESTEKKDDGFLNIPDSIMEELPFA
jgi:single-strand DNA-binding protein